MPAVKRRSKHQQMIEFNTNHPPGSVMRLKLTRRPDPEHDPHVVVAGECWLNHDSIFVRLQGRGTAVSIAQLYSVDNG